MWAVAGGGINAWKKPSVPGDHGDPKSLRGPLGDSVTAAALLWLSLSCAVHRPQLFIFPAESRDSYQGPEQSGPSLLGRGASQQTHWIPAALADGQSSSEGPGVGAVSSPHYATPTSTIHPSPHHHQIWRALGRTEGTGAWVEGCRSTLLWPRERTGPVLTVTHRPWGHESPAPFPFRCAGCPRGD